MRILYYTYINKVYISNIVIIMCKVFNMFRYFILRGFIGSYVGEKIDTYECLQFETINLFESIPLTIFSTEWHEEHI